MKKIKSFFIIVIMLLSLPLFPIRCEAAGALEDLGGVDNLINYGQVKEGSYSSFASKVGVFLTIIQVIGSIISVIILIILGLKYMMGSAEEKAQYKKTLVPYLIGAILIFATTNILSIVYNVTITVFK